MEVNRKKGYEGQRFKILPSEFVDDPLCLEQSVRLLNLRIHRKNEGKMSQLIFVT